MAMLRPESARPATGATILKVEFIAPSAATKPRTAWAALVFEGAVQSPAAARIDRLAGGSLAGAATAVGFTGTKGRNLDLIAPSGVQVSRVLLIGAGAE